MLAPGGLWPRLLEPLVRDALARDMPTRMEPDLEMIQERITRLLQAELDLLSDADRARVLTLVHDELGSRIAEWGSAGGRAVREEPARPLPPI